MKVFIFINAPFPEGMASTRRVLCYAKGLAAAGVEAEIDVMHPFYAKESDADFPSVGVFEGITYNYICGKVYPHSAIRRKLKRNISDMIALYSFAIKHVKKGDIIYCNFRRIVSAYVLMLAAKKTGAKIVHELCEIPYINMKFKSRFKRWYYQTFQIQHFDGIVPISHTLDEYVHQHSPKTKTLIVPILVEDDKNVKMEVNSYKDPYIVHTGTMQENKDGISYILKAFALFKKGDISDCRLVFTGPQANDKCCYLPLIESLGIRPYVDLLGMVSMEKVTCLQHHAALSIIYKSENLQTKYCFPTKLGEMLVSGVPVIATYVGEANYYLKDRENAYVVKPFDIEGLANTMTHVMTNKDESQKIGIQGRKLALDSFSPIYHGKNMAAFFGSL